MNQIFGKKDHCGNCLHKSLKSTETPCNECNVWGKDPFPKWVKAE
jgi:hypothetical protein